MLPRSPRQLALDALIEYLKSQIAPNTANATMSGALAEAQLFPTDASAHYAAVAAVQSLLTYDAGFNPLRAPDWAGPMGAQPQPLPPTDLPPAEASAPATPLADGDSEIPNTPDEKPLLHCPHCEYTTPHTGWMTRHMATTHRQERPTVTPAADGLRLQRDRIHAAAAKAGVSIKPAPTAARAAEPARGVVRATENGVPVEVRPHRPRYCPSCFRSVPLEAVTCPHERCGVKLKGN